MSGRGAGDGLHPVLAEAVTARLQGPRYSELTIEEARELSRSRQGAPTRLPPVFAVGDVSIESDAGPIPARLYRPSGKSMLPLMVYFHGGAFVMGDLESHDAILRKVVADCGIMVLSVDYRLAPEHPFPAAIDDAGAALRHVLARAEAMGADPAAILVGGDSAGGAIAIAAGRGQPQVAGMVLIYPVTDLSRLGETESYRRFGSGAVGLSLDDMQWATGLYAPDPASRLDWRCSPLRAEPPLDMPPAFVVTAELDVLRSEGETFAGLLADNGCQVEHLAVRGVNHGFIAAFGKVPQADSAIAALADWIDRTCRPETIEPGRVTS
ncbi:alpha/beta hydrolase [Frigidibacter sp. ROC022]|uniref:alpha/beta hydrolase n=1 Tax=Frigidibacter sp. ROC022 TaxID=2971796 RepID=UPI00215A8EE0|nr:alpha/beta hydrolase [Frigidibacter sp. ROC022]MCR8726004.1 alpha/beta hydrolase [Frigidibacter sp. ROC022]